MWQTLGTGLMRSLPLVAVLALSAGRPASAQEVVSLEQALQAALANNQVVRNARLAVRVADQQVREAWSNVLPDISANASYSRNVKVQQAFLPAIIFDPSAPPDELVPVRFGSDNTWTAGLTVEQPLFEYGVFVGLSAAGRFRNLERERMRGTAQQVVTGVRQFYLDALLAEEEVRLTSQSVERVRQTLAETRAMNRAGLASDYDVLRLDVQLANLEPNLQRAEHAALATRRELLVAMGREPDGAAAVQLEGRLNELDLTRFAANQPANQGLLRFAGAAGAVSGSADGDPADQGTPGERSDVQQARLAIELDRARLAAQRGEYFPRISLFSSYGITAQQNGGPQFFGTAQQRATSAVAGIRVELSLFNGFAREARVQQARATLGQAEARLEQLEHEAARDVQTLTDAVREARRRSDSQRQAVAQARRGYDIASAEYRAGLGSQLQITDAEVALRQSEFNYARAVYDFLLAGARLEAALGQVAVR